MRGSGRGKSRGKGGGRETRSRKVEIRWKKKREGIGGWWGGGQGGESE
jgi:hypothetical protein